MRQHNEPRRHTDADNHNDTFLNDPREANMDQYESAIHKFLELIFKEDYENIVRLPNIKKWKAFVFQLITNPKILKQFEEEEFCLTDAFLNVKDLRFNKKCDLQYTNLDNLLKKFIYFLDYSIKFKGREYRPSIIIVIQWIYKILERSSGKQTQQIVRILLKYNISKMILEIICNQNLKR